MLLKTYQSIHFANVWSTNFSTMKLEQKIHLLHLRNNLSKFHTDCCVGDSD